MTLPAGSVMETVSGKVAMNIEYARATMSAWFSMSSERLASSVMRPEGVSPLLCESAAVNGAVAWAEDEEAAGAAALDAGAETAATAPAAATPATTAAAAATPALEPAAAEEEGALFRPVSFDAGSSAGTLGIVSSARAGDGPRDLFPSAATAAAGPEALPARPLLASAVHNMKVKGRGMGKE